MFKPTSAPVWPSAKPNGMMSSRAADMPAIMTPSPMRTILMDRDMAAEKGVVADRDVAAEHHVVGERHVVADLAIVADMGADHEEAALADARDAAAVFGAGVHGDALRAARSARR